MVSSNNCYSEMYFRVHQDFTTLHWYSHLLHLIRSDDLPNPNLNPWTSIWQNLFHTFNVWKQKLNMQWWLSYLYFQKIQWPYSSCFKNNFERVCTGQIQWTHLFCTLNLYCVIRTVHLCFIIPYKCSIHSMYMWPIMYLSFLAGIK